MILEITWENSVITTKAMAVRERIRFAIAKGRKGITMLAIGEDSKIIIEAIKDTEKAICSGH